MASFAKITTVLTFFPSMNSLNFKLPCKNYSHTTVTEIVSPSPNYDECKLAKIELNLQGFYKLFVQPLCGFQPIPTERDYIVSPVYRHQFAFPLSFVTKGHDFLASVVF
jgi:hypothetical protein